MRFFLAVFFVLLTCCPYWAYALDLKVALAVQELPGAGRVGNPGASGVGLEAFNTELAQEVCRRINARCTLEKVVFAEILPGVESGQFKLGFGNFLRTAEREKRVGFSDAIWRSSSRLLSRPATAQRFAARQAVDISIDTLREARVVAVAETQQHIFLQKIADENGLTIITARTMAEAFALLRDDRADFGLFAILNAYALLGREPAGKFEFVGAAEAGRGLGGTVHIALPRVEEVLCQAINKAIAGLRADGTFHRIVRRHFPFSLE